MAYRYDPVEGLVIVPDNKGNTGKKNVKSNLPKTYPADYPQAADPNRPAYRQDAVEGLVTNQGPGMMSPRTTQQYYANNGQIERAPVVDEPPSSPTNSGYSVSRAYSNGLEPTTDPTLMSGQELADLFGMTFGREQIENILRQATNEKFDEWGAQTEKLRDQSLTDYASNYNMYLQNSRANKQNAVKHGISRGANVAQEVMGSLGAQQYGAENQENYQQQMGDIAFQRGSQLAYDKYNAMTQQNELANSLAGHSITQYGNQVQEKAAEQSLYGQAIQADAGVTAAQIAANAQTNSARITAQGYIDSSKSSQSDFNSLVNGFVSQGYSREASFAFASGSITYEDFIATKPAPYTPPPAGRNTTRVVTGMNKGQTKKVDLKKVM